MAPPKFTLPSLDFKVELVPAAAATAMKNAEAKKGDLYNVPIANIRVLPDFNVRVRETQDYKDGIQALTESISANGFYAHKPLAGYAAKDGDATIIYLEDGHRRLEAVEAFNFAAGADAQIATLPVIVAPQATTMEDMLVNLVQSNSGKDLTPYEKGVVVKRLLGFGMDKKTVASRLGFTPRYIDDLLVLVGAPAAVRTLMLNNQVSSTQALRELRKDPAQAGARLTAAVKTATDAGKSKATAKDTAKAAGGPKMQKIAISVNFGKGDVMGAVLKVLAGQLRSNVPHDAEGDADLIHVDGSISVTLSVPEPEPAPAPAPAAKPAAAAKPAKPPKPAKGDAAKKTAAAAAAAGLVPAGDDPLAHALGGGAEAKPELTGVEDL